MTETYHTPIPENSEATTDVLNGPLGELDAELVAQDGRLDTLEAAGTGEDNTASNVGTAGVGLFKQKSGVDLEFKKINAGSAKVTITDDVGNNEVDIDVDPAQIAHGDLQNSGTNTHAQIDSHIGNTSNPHGVTAAQAGALPAGTKLDDLAEPDDNTDLDFSTTKHGLVPKGTNVGNFLKDDGTWGSPAGGGSSLTYNNTTVTTSDVNASEDNVYNCTIAGMTANRNIVLPAPSAAGKIIRVNILDGDDDYELIVKGTTGITINGGTAATEWSRLFIANETVTLESSSTGNWQVTEDGRIPCKCQLSVGTGQNISSGVETKIDMDTEEFDIGDLGDTGNNRINVRRANKYIAECFVSLVLNASSTPRFIALLYGTDSLRLARTEFNLNSGQDGFITLVSVCELTTSNFIKSAAYQSSGSTRQVGGAVENHISLLEVL